MSKKLFVTAFFTAIAILAFASGCATVQQKPTATLETQDTYVPAPMDPLDLAKQAYEDKKLEVAQTENALAGAKVEKDQAAVGYRDALRKKAEEIRVAQEAAKAKEQELLAEANAIGGEGDFAPAPTDLASDAHVDFAYPGGNTWDRDVTIPLPKGWKAFFKGDTLYLYVDGKLAVTGTVKVGAKYRLTAKDLTQM